MFILYNILLIVLSPIWGPAMLWKHYKRKDKINWQERQGNYPFTMRKDRKRIWIHAVSVGEVIAAKPIIERVKKLAPDFEIVLSVTTPTGHATAEEQIGDLVEHLVYFPIDLPRFTLAAMTRVQPAAIAIMETELWMNFLWAAKVLDCPTLLINGRISDRSFKRSGPVRGLMKAILANVDRCLMQTQLDVERISAYGAKSAEVYGNSKFDHSIDDSDRTVDQWQRELHLDPNKLVLVIGSTRGEEEERFVLDALRQLPVDQLQIIHAPRHFDRIESLAADVSERFGHVARRSKGETGPYLLLDTYGELASVYGVADIVVIGGGFAPLGGQNLIQPLAHGKPVIHGPNMSNFAEAARAAKAAGATLTASTPDELSLAIKTLMDSPSLRGEMGNAAKDFVDRNRGASDRYADAIVDAAKDFAEKYEVRRKEREARRSQAGR